jgi:hypothetical protein
MTRLYTFAAAGAIAACIGGIAWSQTVQSGGAATAGASGGAGVSGSGGATGATGQAGANAGAAGQAGAQTQIPSNVPGQLQFNSPANRGVFDGPVRNPFFMDPGARRQLNMNDQQFNQMNQAYQNALQQYNQRLNQLGTNPNLTPQQRAAQMQQLQAQFNQQFGQTVDTTFTDPRVRQRFNQLNRQFQPFAALNDATVTQQLQITPEQQRQLRLLGSRWRQQMQRLRRAGSSAANDPTRADQQFAAMQLQYQQQMQQVLTPEQWQAWTQMTGEQYNFPQTAFFPPQGNDLRTAERQSIGVPNRSVNGVQNDSNAKRDGNVGVTQGTPFKGAQ